MLAFVEDSAAFVRGWIQPPASLLEIGAGSGDLTAALIGAGYSVYGIDSDPTAVATAVAARRPVQCAVWPMELSARYDGALLVRALHHLGDLDRALAAVRVALRPQALVLVEDAAFADASAETFDWLRSWVEHAAARNLLTFTLHPVVRRLLHGDGGAGADDERAVHSAAAMDAALRRHFDVASSGGAAYLYRYLAASIRAADPRSLELIRDVLLAERAAIAAGTLAAVGRRWVARIS